MQGQHFPPLSKILGREKEYIIRRLKSEINFSLHILGSPSAVFPWDAPAAPPLPLPHDAVPGQSAGSRSSSVVRSKLMPESLAYRSAEISTRCVSLEEHRDPLFTVEGAGMEFHHDSYLCLVFLNLQLALHICPNCKSSLKTGRRAARLGAFLLPLLQPP